MFRPSIFNYNPCLMMAPTRRGEQGWRQALLVWGLSAWTWPLTPFPLGLKVLFLYGFLLTSPCCSLLTMLTDCLQNYQTLALLENTVREEFCLPVWT